MQPYHRLNNHAAISSYTSPRNQREVLNGGLWEVVIYSFIHIYTLIGAALSLAWAVVTYSVDSFIAFPETETVSIVVWIASLMSSALTTTGQGWDLSDSETGAKLDQHGPSVSPPRHTGRPFDVREYDSFPMPLIPTYFFPVPSFILLSVYAH